LSSRNARQKIEKEHNLSNFQFSVFGINILENQEKDYRLEHVITESNKKGFGYQIVLNFSGQANNNHENTPSTMVSAVSPHSTTGNKSTLPYTPILRSSKEMSPKLLSFNSTKTNKEPESVVKRSIQTPYLEEDIKSATDLFEKERMTLYNQTIIKIASDHRLADWGVQARDGLVDTIWTKKKTDMLELEFYTLHKKLEKEKEDQIYKEKLEKIQSVESKLQKGFDKLLESKYNLESNYEKLCKELKVNKSLSKRKALEAEFDTFYLNLKEKQSNLIKNFASTKNLLRELIKEKEANHDTFVNDNTTEELSENEIAELVVEIEIEENEIEE